LSDLNLALALFGGLVLLLGVVSDFIKQYVSFVTEPVVALAYGVAIGPAGLGLLRIATFGDPLPILEQAARLTLGLAVLGVAIRLPKKYIFERWKAMTVVLLVIMPGTWIISGLIVNAFFGVPWWMGMVIGAILTPTDPVIAGTIVTGTAAEEYIPSRLRHYISAESAINDGVAYLLLFLPLLLLRHSTDTALREWVFVVLLKEVLLAAFVGFVIGYFAGRLQRWATARDFIVKPSLLTIVIALTFAVLGFIKLFGADGILAAFMAGVAFKLPTEEEAAEQEQDAQEALERLFEIPVFVIFGMMLPWQGWIELGWWGLLFTGVVLLLRRLTVLLPVSKLLPPLQRRADALFTGWFGPIGIAAIYYATLVVHETGSRQAWRISTLVIAASILAYGVTATPFTNLYGAKADGTDASSN
jgi:NhaP-type Na+/H+ or K+/H+ antiporter